MSEQNRTVRDSFRKLVLPGVFIGISLVALITVFFVITARLADLRDTPSDNLTWSLSQVEVDVLKLQHTAQRLGSTDASDLDTLRRRFDNVYSRVNGITQSPLFAQMRDDAKFTADLRRLMTQLDAATRVVDLPNAELLAKMSDVRNLTDGFTEDARSLSLRGIELAAAASDQERGSLSSLLTVVELITGSVVFVFLGIFFYMLRQAEEAGEIATRAFRANARLKSTFDVSLDAIVVADTDGRILEFNSAAEEVFQFSAEDVIGQEMSELIIPEQHRAGHRAGMKRYRETNRPVLVGQGRIEITALRKSGEEFPIEISIGRAKDDRGDIFISYVRDITQRVEGQKALLEARDEAVKAEEAKSNFLAVMSHEMRTPLNGVFGAIDLLKATKVNKEQKRYLNIAQQSGEILLGHVDSVLDVTRLDSGVMDLVFDPIDVEKFFKDIVSANAPEAAKRNNKLKLDLGHIETGFIEADKQRVRQIIYNLLGNALKFTENGSITLKASVTQIADSAGQLNVSVSDTGVGIPVAEHARIFQRFYTHEKSYDRRASGAGLGLAICKQLLDLMDGTIDVESRVGAGTTFTVQIPVKILADVGRQTQEGRTDQALARLDGLRVLLAEDNEINRLIVRRMLESSGAEVQEAHNGAEAVTAANAEAFSVILMDISMPVLNGLDAAQNIRNGAGPNAKSPILALTAHALDEEQEPIVAAGLQPGLRKPISRAALVQALAEFVPNPTETRAQPSSEETPLVDIEIVQGLRDVFDKDRLEAMLAKHHAEIEAMFASVEAAPHPGPEAEIAKVVHSCAGASGLMGATRLQSALSKLETAAKTDTDTADALTAQVATVRQVWADTKPALRAALTDDTYPKG